MKKTLILILAALLALSTLSAFALTNCMVVDNCDSWVSLRSAPSKSASRVAKVPLGEEVWPCEEAENGFVYCEYEGNSGYILEEYLREINDIEEERNGYRLSGVYRPVNDFEDLDIVCTDRYGDVLWSKTVRCTHEATELHGCAAFLAGTADEPLVITWDGNALTAHDAETYANVWSKSIDNLAIQCHAVADDGTMYVGGFYGPDPVAIDADGNVLWRSDCKNDDLFWLYEITLEDDAIACAYDSTGEIVRYDLDGNFLG